MKLYNKAQNLVQTRALILELRQNISIITLKKIFILTFIVSSTTASALPLSIHCTTYQSDSYNPNSKLTINLDSDNIIDGTFQKVEIITKNFYERIDIPVPACAKVNAKRSSLLASLKGAEIKYRTNDGTPYYSPLMFNTGFVVLSPYPYSMCKGFPHGKVKNISIGICDGEIGEGASDGTPLRVEGSFSIEDAIIDDMEGSSSGGRCDLNDISALRSALNVKCPMLKQ